MTLKNEKSQDEALKTSFFDRNKFLKNYKRRKKARVPENFRRGWILNIRPPE